MSQPSNKELIETIESHIVFYEKIYSPLRRRKSKELTSHEWLLVWFLRDALNGLSSAKETIIDIESEATNATT